MPPVSKVSRTTSWSQQVLSRQLAALVKQVMSPDFQPFLSRRRVDTLLYISIAISAGNRVGSVAVQTAVAKAKMDHTVGLRWKHCELFVHKNPAGGDNILSAAVSLWHMKTNQNRGQRYILAPRQPMVLNGPALLFVAALQDEVLVGNPTVAQLLDPASLGKDDFRSIAIKVDS